ncbi:MAG: tRNA dihydrouridine synthase DusB [Chthoniobacterales bacterium]
MASRPLLFLAPMAGVTNSIFRRICQGFGADILTSEFVSADGILHRNKRTREYLEFLESERPFGVQLFGGDPEKLAEGARCVAEWVRPDFIDLNFGCPVNKVVCRHGGSALLKDCPLLERVAKAVVAAVEPLPVTAKIRIGWDEKSINAVETSRLLEDCGITRIAVHGRTKEQGYSGEANWDVIADVVSAVKVPVIGNGDLSSAEIASQRLHESGVAGLMIGRTAMSSPWIFRQIRTYLETGEQAPEPTLQERWDLILDHARQEIQWRGDENFALRSMRSRLMAYSRGMVGGKHLREKFSKITSIAGLEDIASEHKKSSTATKNALQG